MDIHIIFLIAFGFACAGLGLYILMSRVSQLQKRVSFLEAQVEAYLKEHLDDYIDGKYKDKE